MEVLILKYRNMIRLNNEQVRKYSKQHLYDECAKLNEKNALIMLFIRDLENELSKNIAR